ncbi:unnamed protein product, partial [Sphacelaria rigidula]
MWSYGGSVHARRALSRLITRRNPYCCTAEPLASAALTTTTTTTKSPGEDTCATSCISSAAVALACLLASTDSEASLKHAGSSDDGIRGGRAYCRGQKIVWVDSYGRKVAVQEKDMPNHALATQENATDGAIPRFCPYVIVGFGIAGQAALRALLERDPAAHVLVVD